MVSVSGLCEPRAFLVSLQHVKKKNSPSQSSAAFVVRVARRAICSLVLENAERPLAVADCPRAGPPGPGTCSPSCRKQGSSRKCRGDRRLPWQCPPLRDAGLASGSLRGRRHRPQDRRDICLQNVREQALGPLTFLFSRNSVFLFRS